MSLYTSLGITVSPEAARYFLQYLSSLDERPDHVSRLHDGTVSAVWEHHNHFDPYTSSSEYKKIIDFLDGLGWENYVFESVTEDSEPVVAGGYSFGFARVTTYRMYGDDVDIAAVVSQNRKPRSRLLQRLRGRRTP